MKKILIVDDEPMSLMIAKKFLSSEYQTDSACSGTEMFDYLKHNRPDLILLDLIFKGENGRDLMMKLQEDPDLAQIPVIFISSEQNGRVEEECFSLGARDYIEKPFYPNSMMSRVRKTLELEDYRRNLEELVSRQVEKITRMQKQVILMMASLIDQREDNTGDHIRRTCSYLNLFLGKLRESGIYESILTREYVSQIKKAAPLYDLGKITVPESILNKPGRLTAEEFERVKLHTVEGKRLINSYLSELDPEFVKLAGEMAVAHHERWDGKGYPFGIKGEDIPFGARLIAMVDTFDALVSDNSYRKGKSVQEALDIMAEGSGGYYDPDLVGVFLSVQPELEALHNRHIEQDRQEKSSLAESLEKQLGSDFTEISTIPEETDFGDSADEKICPDDGWQLYIAGSRGSYPVNGDRYREFGGATSCYILHKNDYALVLDCGSGLYHAGHIFDHCKKIDVVLSHLHYDHMIGLLGAFGKFMGKEIDFYSTFDHWFGNETMNEFFRQPFWPITPVYGELHTVKSLNTVRLNDDISILLAPSNHPNGANIVRVNFEDQSLCMICDFEHEGPNPVPAEIAAGCQTMIYDGSYTDSEYLVCKGWGHSTWEQGLKLAQKYDIEQLLISHHEPAHSDRMLLEMERQAQMRERTIHFARMGETILL